jgi:hypothetical protein
MNSPSVPVDKWFSKNRTDINKSIGFVLESRYTWKKKYCATGLYLKTFLSVSGC